MTKPATRSRFKVTSIRRESHAVLGFGIQGFGNLSKIPNSQPLNFLGSYSLVGIGKFNLLLLWSIGCLSWGLAFREP